VSGEFSLFLVQCPLRSFRVVVVTHLESFTFLVRPPRMGSISPRDIIIEPVFDRPNSPARSLSHLHPPGPRYWLSAWMRVRDGTCDDT